MSPRLMRVCPTPQEALDLGSYTFPPKSTVQNSRDINMTMVRQEVNGSSDLSDSDERDQIQQSLLGSTRTGFHNTLSPAFNIRNDPFEAMQQAGSTMGVRHDSHLNVNIPEGADDGNVRSLFQYRADKTYEHNSQSNDLHQDSGSSDDADAIGELDDESGFAPPRPATISLSDVSSQQVSATQSPIEAPFNGVFSFYPPFHGGDPHHYGVMLPRSAPATTASTTALRQQQMAAIAHYSSAGGFLSVNGEVYHDHVSGAACTGCIQEELARHRAIVAAGRFDPIGMPSHRHHFDFARGHRQQSQEHQYSPEDRNDYMSADAESAEEDDDYAEQDGNGNKRKQRPRKQANARKTKYQRTSSNPKMSPGKNNDADKQAGGSRRKNPFVPKPLFVPSPAAMLAPGVKAVHAGALSAGDREVYFPGTSKKGIPKDERDFAHLTFSKQSRGRRPADADQAVRYAKPGTIPGPGEIAYAGLTKDGRAKKMFECKAPECGKIFKRSEHLKRHIRGVHLDDKHITGQTAFQCQWPDCGRLFARHDNLSQHLRTHRSPSMTEIDFAEALQSYFKEPQTRSVEQAEARENALIDQAMHAMSNPFHNQSGEAAESVREDAQVEDHDRHEANSEQESFVEQVELGNGGPSTSSSGSSRSVKDNQSWSAKSRSTAKLKKTNLMPDQFYQPDFSPKIPTDRLGLAPPQPKGSNVNETVVDRAERDESEEPDDGEWRPSRGARGHQRV
ncbi:hypothetical protein OIO90_000526 [Microbotryomycetes sp. JL221]|nr:hypothetical protein OIO90_000526 [Microbotryomycetes sp. JL221]